MSDILVKLIGLGNEIGTVTSANMYDHGFMSVDGVTVNGRKFSITLSVSKEECNDES